jgi:hypothetical protein
MVRLLYLVFFLLSCSSKERQVWREYRALLESGSYPQAQIILEKSFKKAHEKEKLHYLMELASLAYFQQDYTKSSTLFSEAIEYVDQLYTKSVSEKVGKYFISESSEKFLGAAYERSWLYYFAAMSYLKLHNQREKKSDNTNLFKARALMLGWDSFFQEHQRTNENKTIYQHDLVAKILAAHVHELTGIAADRQISKQLYKDALDLLNSWGGGFSLFNQNHSEYLEKVKKAVYDGKAPSKLTFTPTENFIELKKVLDSKIASITKNKLSFEHVVFLEEGFIPEKKAEVIPVGLKGLASLIKDPTTKKIMVEVGADIITYFAMEKLGLIPHNVASANRFFLARDITEITVKEAAIEMEVPKLSSFSPLESFNLELKDEANTVTKVPLITLTDLADQAQLVMDEEASLRFLRTGVRIGIKYITAIVSAMAVYRSLNDNKVEGDNFIAKAAAMGTFLAATKILKDHADIRAWSSLPRSVRIGFLDLGNKSYDLSISNLNNSQNQTVAKKLGQVSKTFSSGISSYHFAH